MGLGFHGAKGGLLTGGFLCPCLFVMSTAFRYGRRFFCAKGADAPCYR